MHGGGWGHRLRQETIDPRQMVCISAMSRRRAGRGARDGGIWISTDRKDRKDARVVSQDLGAYYIGLGGSKRLFTPHRIIPIITKCSPSAKDTDIELPKEDSWLDNSLLLFRVEAQLQVEQRRNTQRGRIRVFEN